MAFRGLMKSANARVLCKSPTYLVLVMGSDSQRLLGFDRARQDIINIDVGKVDAVLNDNDEKRLRFITNPASVAKAGMFTATPTEAHVHLECGITRALVQQALWSEMMELVNTDADV